MAAEITRFMEVYNEAWGRNWGFVPITEAEVDFQAANLKPILDEDWAMIAEKDGEVVGAALTLPDVDQALAKMNGRLLPFGWLTLPAPQELDRSSAGLRARGEARVPAPGGSRPRCTCATSRRRPTSACPAATSAGSSRTTSR